MEAIVAPQDPSRTATNKPVSGLLRLNARGVRRPSRAGPYRAVLLIEAREVCAIEPQRRVSTDKRLTPLAIEAVSAKASLSRLTRQAVCDTFAEAWLLSDGQMNAVMVATR
jgi:hypothetical protein